MSGLICVILNVFTMSHWRKHTAPGLWNVHIHGHDMVKYDAMVSDKYWLILPVVSSRIFMFTTITPFSFMLFEML